MNIVLFHANKYPSALFERKRKILIPQNLVKMLERGFGKSTRFTFLKNMELIYLIELRLGGDILAGVIWSKFIPLK